MNTDAAFRTMQVAATAIAELAPDDDRVPGLARDMAAAWMVIHTMMMSGSMPLEWSTTGQWRWVGKP